MTDLVGYTPGESWLISGAAAMVMTAADAPSARRFWNLVRSSASAAELIDGISPGPAAGALAILVWEPAGVRALVRGTAVVRVRSAAGPRSEVSAADLLTWREELLVDVVAVEVALTERDLPADAPDDADLLPVPAGVVRATFARRRTDDLPTPPAGGDPGAAVEPWPVGPVATEPPIAEPGYSGPAAQPTAEYIEPAPESFEPGPAPAGSAGRSPELGDRAAPVDENVVGDDAVTVISMVPAPSRGLPATGSPAGLDAFGGTNGSAGESGSVPRSVPPEAPEDLGPASSDGGNDVPPESSDEAREDAAARHRAPDVTQSVPLDHEEDPILERVSSADPGRAASVDRTPPIEPAPDLLPGPPEPGRPEPVLGDHDGITELAEDLPAGFTPPPLPPPLAAGWVYASLCPSGHANQPHAGNCRICGQPIPPGDPVAAPQPLLGRLRFSTGELVDLDRRVIIGRAPSVSRVSSSELPRLVTVPSPQQDISRSHAELRIEDWHVVVADLHSTNGTVLRAPDRPEQLLHPGQEMVIEPGWTVDLGDGVTVAVEAAG